MLLYVIPLSDQDILRYSADKLLRVMLVMLQLRSYVTESDRFESRWSSGRIPNCARVQLVETNLTLVADK